MAWVQYDINPVDKSGRVGDCAVRAVSVALGISWERAYTKLALNGFLMGDMPNSDRVWSSVLRQEGFVREMIPNTCPECYTVQQFCADHPKGTFVLKSDGHVATVIDGNLLDSWNSESKVPIYYWTKGADKNAKL